MRSIIERDLESIWILFFTIFILIPMGIIVSLFAMIADWWEEV